MEAGSNLKITTTGKMPQYTVFSLDCKLILKSFIIAQLMACRPLGIPLFTVHKTILKDLLYSNLLLKGFQCPVLNATLAM